MKYQKTNAETTTITRNVVDFETNGRNIYEALNVLSKRANQIGLEIKDELNGKLAEFATASDNLDEVFENREQIEISKFYERLPKPALIAIQEYLEESLYIRKRDEEVETTEGK
ncbi:MAG: DNA-directed RNA polymerase subunit omega [Flavobacteriales bacterium]|nr:DNA-directed RNA polymerase subunit omega [Flavobacteriales bacterium]